jgi:hypothetical protein
MPTKNFELGKTQSWKVITVFNLKLAPLERFEYSFIYIKQYFI